MIADAVIDRQTSLGNCLNARPKVTKEMTGFSPTGGSKPAR
jgi:hypothetical protein